MVSVLVLRVGVSHSLLNTCDLKVSLVIRGIALEKCRGSIG